MELVKATLFAVASTVGIFVMPDQWRQGHLAACRA
jgi:hypothetical protein